MPGTHAPVSERIERHCIPEPNTGCWLWTGHLDKYGYGKITVGRSSRLAHRIAYEAFIGPIPDGLTLDHRCRTPQCVNPAHMDPMPLKDNILLGRSPAALASRRDRCHLGHVYTDGSFVFYRGVRYCLVCRRLRQERRAA